MKTITVPVTTWALGDNEIPGGYARPLYRVIPATSKEFVISEYQRVATITEPTAAGEILRALERGR